MRPAALLVPALLLCVSTLAAQTTFTLPGPTALNPVERELLRFEQERSATLARHDIASLLRGGQWVIVAAQGTLAPATRRLRS